MFACRSPSLKMTSTAPGDLGCARRQRGCPDNGASLRRRSTPRQHALEHPIALHQPMIEGAGDMERDDRCDQNSADEMPDENPVGQRLVLAQYGRKVEQAENADRIAVS